MVDIVNTATWQSKLDSSNYVAGAEEMTAAADQATAATVRLETSTAKVGKAAVVTEAGWKRFVASVDPATAAYERFIRQQDRLAQFSAAGFGGAEKAIAEKALLARATADMDSYLRGLGLVRKESAATAGATAMTVDGFRGLFDAVRAGKAGALDGYIRDMGYVAAETEHATGTARKAREGLVLLHEAASGNWKRFFGSAMIEVQNFGVLGYAAIAAGIVAPFGAATLAAVSLRNEYDRIDKTLIATGNAAGVTRDRIVDTAKALNGQNGLTIRGGIDIEASLISRGAVSPALLSAATLAARGYGLATGQNNEAAGAAFEKLLADPAKGAKDLADNFGLLSPKILRTIGDMEQQGRYFDAQKLLIDAVNTRFGHLEDSSWSLAKAFDRAKDWLSNLWFHTGEAVGGAQTDQQKLWAAQGSLAWWKNRQQQVSNIRPDLRAGIEWFQLNVAPNAIAGLTRTIDDLTKKMAKDAAAAAAGERKTTSDRYATDLLNAHNTLDPYTEQLRALDNRQALLFGANWKRGMPLSQAREVQSGNASEAQAARDLKLLDAERYRILHEQNNLLNLQDKDYRKIKETAEQYLAGLRQEVTAAGLSAAERAREAEVIKGAQVVQKARDVAERDLVKTYEDALAVLGKQRALEIAGLVDQKAAAALALQQRDAMAQAVVSLTAYRTQRDLALAILKQETELGRQLTEQEVARLRAIQSVNDAISFRNIIEKQQDQLRLAGMYGEHLQREQEVLAAIDATHGNLSDKQADILRSYIDQNHELERQRQLVSGIQGTFEGFYDKLLHGKFDFKSLASGLVDQFATYESRQLATGTMSLLFPQRNVAAGGAGVATADAAKGLFAHIFGGTPKGTAFDPLHVVMDTPFAAGASGLPAALSSPGTGGLVGFVKSLFGESAGPIPYVNVTPMQSLSGGGSGGLLDMIGSALARFAGIFDEGGTIGPGQWGIKGGLPEVIQGGTHGVSVMPVPNYSNSNGRGGHTFHIAIDARGAQAGVGDEIAAKLEPMMRRIANEQVGHAAPAIASMAIQGVSSKLGNSGRGRLT